MPNRDILVLGASAGGVQALSQVVEGFPADLPAAVFVVLHVAPHGTSAMPNILSRSGPLRAIHPQDGEPIERGTVYVAPPDHHLIVERGRVRVSRRPSENSYRPAVDVGAASTARALMPGEPYTLTCSSMRSLRKASAWLSASWARRS